MKLDRVHNEVEQVGTMQVAKATIKATPKIFDFFANQTYANKPVAILRELVANAIDAHTASGQTRPVEVKLPTELDPTFEVKDFGTGMSRDFVMGPFMAYTDGSTKDSSNDQIGGFGIGSKSPFAYVDQFTLRVVHDGVLSVYTMFKDTDGIPAIGLQAETTTDEHNGVSVSFPVQEGDIDTFRNAAQTALQYFRPLPLGENGTLNPPEYTFTGTNWALRPSAGELGIIMGGVRYPVTKESLEYDLRNDANLSPLLSYGIDLTMPIGSASIALSREALSYDKKTSDNIKAALLGVVKDVVKTFANMFDNQPTVWEASKQLYKEIGSNTSRYSQNPRQQLLAANAVYQGQKLETQVRIEHLDGFKGWVVPERNAWGRQKAVKTPKWESPRDLRLLFPGQIETIIIDDLPDSPKSKTGIRLREFIEQAPRTGMILVLRINDLNPGGFKREDAGAYDDIIKKIGGPQTDLITTSSLPEPAPTSVKVAKVKGVRPKVRMFTWDGAKQSWSNDDLTNLTPGSGKSVKEIKYVDQPDKGIMVVMNSFDLPKDFHTKMKTNLIAFSELHFVNVGDWAKLEEFGWTKFEDAFQKRLDDVLALKPYLAARRAIAEDAELDDIFDLIRKASPYMPTLSATQMRRPFGKILELYREYREPFIGDDIAIAQFVKPALPKGVNTKKLAAALNSEQADLIVLLNMLPSYRMTREQVALISKIA